VSIFGLPTKLAENMPKWRRTVLLLVGREGASMTVVIRSALHANSLSLSRSVDPEKFRRTREAFENKVPDPADAEGGKAVEISSPLSPGRE